MTVAPSVRGLRLAALLILGYAFALAVNAGIYLSWSGDRGEVPRLGVRLAGSMLLAYGLWKAARWTWWGAVLFSGFVAVIGAPGLYAVVSSGLLARRPYPALELTFLVVGLAALTAAFVVLVLPSTREAVRVGPRYW